MSANLPKQWLDKAAEDLAVSRLVLEEGHTAHACFNSQQCIEKSLKAYLVAKTKTHPRKHNLIDLLTECEQLDRAFAQFRAECATVDRYYVPTRYPDAIAGMSSSGLPSKSEAEEAITAANNILQFVTRQLF